MVSLFTDYFSLITGHGFRVPRCRLLAGFLLLLGGLACAEGVQDLLAQLDSESAGTRAKAAIKLGELADPRAIALLLKRLGDPDTETRWHAAMALSKFGTRAAPGLVAALSHPEEEARWKAQAALKMIGKSATPALLDGLSSKDALVRAESCYVVGEIGDTDAAPALAALLGDEDEPARWKAAAALHQMRSIRVLAKAMESPQARKRQAACWALGEIPQPEILPFLSNALHDEDEEVRWKATVALAARKETALEFLVQSLSFGRIEARRCAAWALQQFQSPAAIPSLVRAIGSEDEVLRWKAAIALEKFSNAAVLPLCQAIEEGPFELQQMALMVLKKIQTPESAQALKRFDELLESAVPGEALATLSQPPHWQFALLPSPVAGDYDFACSVHTPKGGLQTDELRIALGYLSEKEFLYFSLQQNRAALVRVRDGREQVMDKADVGYLLKERWSAPLRIQKTSSQIRVFWDSAPLAAASLPPDLSQSPGYLGLAATTGTIRFSHPRIQPVDRIHFRDDFMRSSLSNGDWAFLAGQWSLNAMLGPETSTNPFRCLGQGAEALCLAGYSFWDRYRFSVCLQALDGAACGIVFGYRNPATYYLFRWFQETGEKARFQLIRRENGSPKLLGENQGLRRLRQWYQLSAEVLDGRIRVSVDDASVFDIAEDHLHSGRIGLYTESQTGTLFDDVSVSSQWFFRDDFQKQSAPDRFWDAHGKGWVLGFRTAWELSSSNGTAYHSGRRPGWLQLKPDPPDPCRIKVRIRSSDGRAGLAFGAPADPAAWACWLEAGRLVIGSPASSSARLLAEVAIPKAKKWQWRELEMERHGNRMTFHSGNSPAIRATPTTAAAVSGPLSLWTEGSASTSFDDFTVEALPSPEPLPLTHRIFQNYVDMDNWAKSASIWQPRTVALENNLLTGMQHAGDFFGDLAIEFPLPENAPAGSAVAAFLAVEGEERPFAVAGWVPTAEGLSRLVLQAGQAAPRCVEFPGSNAAAAPAALRLELAGLEIRASAGASELFSPLPQGKIAGAVRCGFASAGLSLSADQVRLFSGQVIDDMFEHAFVEWEARGGEWGVTNRWICSPQYSWMGGHSPAVAALWSKRAFSGDQTIEYFAGIKMDLAGPPYYSRRADLNLTICGDGENLDSGYAFIFGGWNNTSTRLIRKGQVVAATNAALFPGGGHDAIHHRWFHVKMTRRASKVNCSIDGKLIFEFDDPEPIPGGHVAFWTWKNGMIVARVRAAAQSVSARRFPLLTPPQPSLEPLATGTAVSPVSFPLRVDFETGAGQFQTLDGDQGAALFIDTTRFRSGQRSLCLANLHAGGTLAASCVQTRFEVMRHPWLRFDYRVPGDVKVDFFVRVQDRFFTLGFTRTRQAQKCLALFPEVRADGEWHSTALNLADALRPQFPANPEIWSEEIRLGNPDNEDYLQCGFGGNHARAAWHIDNFEVSDQRPETSDQ